MGKASGIGASAPAKTGAQMPAARARVRGASQYQAWTTGRHRTSSDSVQAKAAAVCSRPRTRRATQTAPATKSAAQSTRAISGPARRASGAKRSDCAVQAVPASNSEPVAPPVAR